MTSSTPSWVAIPFGIYDVANDRRCRSATRRTPLSSLSNRFAGGGREPDVLPGPPKCSVAADVGRRATATRCKPGRPSSRSWPENSVSRSPSATTRQARPSGTDRTPHVLLHHDEVTGSTADRHWSASSDSERYRAWVTVIDKELAALPRRGANGMAAGVARSHPHDVEISSTAGPYSARGVSGSRYWGRRPVLARSIRWG